MNRQARLSSLLLILVSISVSAFAKSKSEYVEDNIYFSESFPDKSTADETEIQPAESPAKLPVYLSELSNLNDYSLFANGGWDGNWYVGFNVCWMEQLPPAPQGEYSRAFIGAKIGRMKTRPVTGKPVWEREPIPGSVYMALSSTSAWKPQQGRFLVSTQEIPLEGDMENALEGVGEARWFWVEVPVKTVNFEGPNYVALWSPTEYFVSTSSSPILAGGWGSSKINSWMNNDVQGYAPLNAATALKTGISTFEPAIAMKLIPKDSQQVIQVKIDGVKDGRFKTNNKTVIAKITGDSLVKAWLEISPDRVNWKKHNRPVYCPPYQLTLRADQLPVGKIAVRCAASDAWENIGYSDIFEVSVTK